MVLLTMIARVADGLPLAASMQEDEQSGRDLQQYQSQAKQLFRKLNEQSPTRCTLEAGAMAFQALTAEGSISQDRTSCDVRESVAELAEKTVNVSSLISSKKILALMKSEARTKAAGVILIKWNL
ncbi:hypothetical protein CIB84_011717 [Bambusicola thoracicus]|uniref:Longin domain-containing protein n=1 Tax=Bambusicola thoracicus TaxID=9083 RepID=A0A2P4SKA2_BAMTH|nr:hypothetical protein CIB84_011717 [Bambusicola thoracicus]